MEGQIIAVCSAPQKGMIKKDVREGVLVEGLGLEGDAHMGFAHRQVSLISMEDIRTMMTKLPTLVPGSFAENLTTEGFDLSLLKIGDMLSVGNTSGSLPNRQGVPLRLRGLQADRRVYNA